MKVTAEAAGVGGLVVLALHHVLGTAVVKAEDLVVHILPGSKDGEILADVEEALRVNLGVGVEVVVAVRSFDAVRNGAPGPTLWLLIRVDVRAVVADAELTRSRRIGRRDVPREGGEVLLIGELHTTDIGVVAVYLLEHEVACVGLRQAGPGGRNDRLLGGDGTRD